MVDAYRAGDVLDRLFTEVIEDQVEFSFDLLVNIRRDSQSAGLGHFLQPRRHVYAVAKEVAAFDHDVPEVDTNA